MGFFVFGLNHKACPVEIREKLHFSPKQISDVLDLSIETPEIEELVILSTCNRVEFYGYSPEGEIPEALLLTWLEKTHCLPRDDFQSYFYQHEGKEAIRHLFRVSSGLDSLVIGENEILGQVRDAFRTANGSGAVHSLLYRLMEKALKVGKDARTQTKINEGAVSIPSVAVELAQKIFGRLDGEKVMVLGTGEMSVLTLENLRNSGADAVYVVSRHAERGKKTAGDFDARWISMEGWEDHLQDVDILIASTAAPHAIVHHQQIRSAMTKRRHKPLLLIDIAVPRNIEASAHEIDNVYLYNVDDLKGVSESNLRLRRKELQAAEDLIEKAVIDYQGWLERLKARPTLERFETFLDEVILGELDRLKPESRLDPKAREEFKQRIRAKILHPPLEKIKEASQNGGVHRYLEALHSLFQLDKKE